MTDIVEVQEVKKITQKITGWRIKKDEDTIEPIVDTLVVQQPLTKLERGEVLYGATYKVKQPSLPNAYEHGFYITINSTNVSGELKPFEIFIETKNVEALPVVNVLSFTLTTLFRQQIDISHLLEEYKSIQVGGGYRGKKHLWQEKPKFYNSYLGEVAEVIEYHLGSLNRTNDIMIDPNMELMEKYLATMEEPDEDIPNFTRPLKSAGICPSCQSEHTALLDNCLTCLDCSYSKCG